VPRPTPTTRTPTALYERDGDRFVPTGLTRGPWDPNAANGGAVAALVARAAEHHEDAGAPVLPDQLVARLTLDLMRPVPLAPLTVRTSTLRPGKKVQLVEIVVEAAGTEFARGLALRMPAAHPDLPPTHEPSPPGPEAFERMGKRDDQAEPLFHSDGVDLRAPARDGRGRDPIVIWVRLAYPVLDGETPSPVVRAAVAADFGSGVSGAAPPGWRSINTDINMHLFRAPEGEWVCFHALSHIAGGVGIAEGGLFDRDGRVGRATQTVLVEPWTWR
jgi:hypothetical protein